MFGMLTSLAKAATAVVTVPVADFVDNLIDASKPDDR